ncbi:MAG: DUF2628 domain-containing protein [Parvibaculum sp.]|nr:DUF2628 domain-containing protein [Parvibaculum sp.]|tara:strand:+ start:14976 stop:15461 length:486 start_codon:yes stop_codon:yes gene_type:complete
MRSYTVHELSGAPADGEGIVLVREGFSWPAAVFALVWLIVKRQWVVAAFYFALSVLLTAAAKWFAATDVLLSVMTIVLQGFLGVAAHDLMRWTLARQGYREIGVASASDLQEAERDFFRHWTGPLNASAPAATPSLSAPVWPRKAVSDEHVPLGLFPHPGN